MWRKTKYLLKTHSFPHCPQVFPQGFSTAGEGVWKSGPIYIKNKDTVRRTSHFFAVGVFYHNIFFVQKIGLDKEVRSVEFETNRSGAGERSLFLRIRVAPAPGGVPRKIAEKFLKKGVDFVGQRRYNVYPYGKLTKEEV